jgi:hypothetical protein
MTTDLLANYDLFLVFEKKNTASSYIQFEWLSFDMGGVIICLWKGTANPELKNVTAFTCGGQNSISGNSFVLRSRYVIGSFWLHNDFG